MEKVLYFEGAGMDFYSEEQTSFSNVGNFRIRTAFKNLDGVEYYLEMGNCPRFNEKYKPITNFALRIDHLFKIEDRHKEELSSGGYELRMNFLELRKLDYTNEAITKWINENLNCDFDTIEVLDNFHGYRVHSDDGGYNIIGDLEINFKRAVARKEAYEKVDQEYRKLLNEKYSKIGLMEMDDKSITIRCHASKEKLGSAPRTKQIEIAV